VRFISIRDESVIARFQDRLNADASATSQLPDNTRFLAQLLDCWDAGKNVPTSDGRLCPQCGTPATLNWNDNGEAWYNCHVPHCGWDERADPETHLHLGKLLKAAQDGSLPVRLPGGERSMIPVDTFGTRRTAPSAHLPEAGVPTEMADLDEDDEEITDEETKLEAAERFRQQNEENGVE
jgi:hypothetical protein